MNTMENDKHVNPEHMKTIKDEIEKIKKPDNWKKIDERMNGSGKLIAIYENHAGVRVIVRPHKTYDMSGFADSHKIDV